MTSAPIVCFDATDYTVSYGDRQSLQQERPVWGVRRGSDRARIPNFLLARVSVGSVVLLSCGSVIDGPTIRTTDLLIRSRQHIQP